MNRHPQDKRTQKDTGSVHYEISVILITPDTWESIRCVIQALQCQTVNHLLELVIVAPARDIPGFQESEIADFAGFQVVEMGEIAIPSEGRAAGVFAAKAPVVAFLEDHCFPDKKWAEALIRRHRESWAGVGPVFGNANPGTVISQANFLMEYGEWAFPASRNPPRHLPGHNSSYKKTILEAYGDRLSEMLLAESPMQWDLMDKGYTFFLEPEARTYHLNYSVFWRTLMFRFHAGRLFASQRTRSWPVFKKIFYFCASPLIPFVRLYRVCRFAARIGQTKRISAVFPVLSVLLGLDGLGEMVGYLAGPGRSAEKTRMHDFHRERFLVSKEQKRMTDYQSILQLRNQKEKSHIK